MHNFSAQVELSPSPYFQFTGYVVDDDGNIELFELVANNQYSSTNLPGKILRQTSNGWILTNNEDRVETFDQKGRLVQITNRSAAAQTLSLAYDTYGRLATVTNEKGRSISFNYGDSVHQDPTQFASLASVTLPDGASLAFSYGSGDLQTVTYPGGAVRTFQYNDTRFPGYLTGIVDENSNPYGTFTYDSVGRAVSSVLNTGNPTSPTADAVSLVYSSDGSSTKVTRASGQTDVFTFNTDPFRKPASIVTNGSLSSQTTYQTDGRPSSVVDKNGTTTTYSYDSYHETSRTEGSGTPSQRTAATIWDPSLDRPTQRTITDAYHTTASLTTWSYNARGQILARCEIAPSVSGAASYACGSSANAPLGIRQSSYAYCEQTAVTAGTCPLIGLVLTATSPRIDVSSTMIYTYFQTTDLTGCSTAGGSCHYLGDLYQITNALGQTTTYVSYDKNGHVTRMKDAGGTVADMTYSPRGWLLTRTVRSNADGSSSSNDATTTFAYDNVGQVIRIIQPDGVYLSYTYDAAHRLTDIADNAGNAIHYTLDATGNRTNETTKDPAGTLTRKLSRQYDQLSHLTKTLNAANTAVHTYRNPTEAAPTSITYTNGYDGNGNAIYSVDANGFGTENQYDPLNRLTKTLQDHAGTGATKDTATQYAYDARDNLRSVTDPDGLVTNYTYDGLNNLSALQSPDTGTSSYTYDAAGNRTGQTDARGVTSTYTYDALNRLTGISYSTTSPNVSYSYAYDQANATTGCASSYPQGRLTTITDNSGSTVYCYDRRGNVTSKKQAANGIISTTGYAYTVADRIQSITYPSGAIVSYTRNALGQITAVTYKANATASAQTLVANASYLPFGPLSQITFGNGRTLSKTYDKDYAISQIASSDPNGLTLQAGVDALGNLTRVDAGSLGRRYSYDPLYRLNQVKDGASAVLESYAYNRTGDRLSKTLGGSTDAYSYSSPLTSHRLANVGGTARTYDANGNTTQIGTNAFVFDNSNRLVHAADYDYYYNGKGERVVKFTQTTGGGGASVSKATPAGVGQTTVVDQTTFVYSESGALLSDTESTTRYNMLSRAAGAITIAATEYIWLDATLVGIVRDGNLYYAETDQLGTPRRVILPGNTTATDAIAWAWDYFGSAFGEHAPDEDPSSNGPFTLNLRFPGQYFDAETGLGYNYFRDYESGTGRYVESDPAGLRGGISTYSYAMLNPLSNHDRLGLRAWNIRWGVGGGVGHIVVGGSVYNLEFSDPISSKSCSYTVYCGGVGVGLPEAGLISQIAKWEDGKGDCSDCNDHAGYGWQVFASAIWGRGYSLGGYLEIPNGPTVTGDFLNKDGGAVRIGTGINLCRFSLN